MVDNYSIYDPVNEIEEERQAHSRSYGQVTGEQQFLERMLSATALDTGVGQLAQSLMYRFELDPNIPDQVDNYNPILDPQIEGLDDHLNEFVTSTSPRETAVRVRMLQKNLQRRKQLENHGFARFMGNVLDPINIIPVPISRGLGFAQGFRKGAIATAAPFAVSETARAQIDPTNPTLEPYFGIAGGALFGGALGGLVGSVPMKNLELSGGAWMGSNDGLDAFNALKTQFGEETAQGLKPHVRKEQGETNFDHLQKIVAKAPTETTTEYTARLQSIADNEEIYNQFVSASKQWDPDELLPTGTAVERMRLSELPYLLLKNNKFEGQLGNMLRQAADRISGPPGLITTGAAAGVKKQAQGVYNRAQTHNRLVTTLNSELYDAYLKSLGKNNIAELTPGQRVVESLADLKPSRARHHNEFKREVIESYLNPEARLSDDPNVLAGVEAIMKYTTAMEKEGLNSGALGISRILNDVSNLEKRIAKQEEFLDTQLAGDVTSRNKQSKSGLINELTETSRKIDRLKEKERGIGLDEKELKSLNETELQAQSLERQFEEINAWRADKDAFVDDLQANPREIINNNVRIAARSHAEARNLRARAQKLEEEGLAQKVDPDAMGYFPRQWNHEAIKQNREEFVAILEKYYAKDGGELARAESTIARILKQLDSFQIKEFMRAEMRKLDVPEEQILVMERKVDGIAQRGRKNKDTIAEHKTKQIEELRVLTKDYMTTYGFGDDVNRNIAAAMSEIEGLAATGNQNFGASTATLAREIKLPSHLFMRKSDGSGPSVDFLEIDPERAFRRYHQRMAASIEMANEFGDPTMRNFMDEVEDLINVEVSKAGSAKEGAELLREGERMIEAMNDLSQKVLGVYRIPADPSSLSARSIRVAKNLMVMSLMGKAMVAALPDMGRIAMSVGLRNAFEGAFNRWGAANKEFIAGGREVTEAGEAAEIALHGRFEAIFDIDGYIFEATPFERMVEGGVNKMFILNGLAPYTDIMKRFSGAIIQSEMMRLSVKLANNSKFVQKDGEQVIEGAAGRLSKDETMLLARNGIGFEEAVLIAKQFETHGTKGDKLFVANAGNWDDPMVRKTFRTALVTEVNNAVITPGPADKPNFMGTGIGSLMFQFKSFAFSATQRTLLAGLQQRDAKVFHGILSMIAMGYMVDFIKSPSYDQRDFTSMDRFVQAVDYSGATGLLFDLNNMVEVMGGNNYGVRPLLGVDSFFKDPNLAQRTGQIGGPVASLGFDLMNNLFDPETSGSDWSRSVRRLLPFNNLIWWSWAVDRLQRSTGEALDGDEE